MKDNYVDDNKYNDFFTINCFLKLITPFLVIFYLFIMIILI